MRRSQRFAAAAAAASVVALCAGGAAAQGLLGGGSWYVKGFGGVTVPQDDDFDVDFKSGGFVADSGFDFDTGYALGIAGGFMATPNVAVELEYAYRNADAELKNSDGSNHKTESNAWMVNALYYFTPVGATGAWQPYAGGGLGAADLNFEEVDTFAGGDFDSDYNFAYQLIGGVAYNINPNVSLNGEARFFGINDQDLENDVFKFKTTYQTFDLLVGLTYHF